ncbi:hypothetical protein BDV12DRAFT_179872 [Aspergillus spectabilis]
MAKISSPYSVPAAARKIFIEEILQNPLISRDLPPETLEYGPSIRFLGTDEPRIPINWRFAESSAVLKALEAALVAALLKRKYGHEASLATINTDHAQLFLASTLLWTARDGDGIKFAAGQDTVDNPLNQYIPDRDIHRAFSSLYRIAATNIYPTKDRKYFHLHGSLDPEPTLTLLGLPADAPANNLEEACRPIASKVAKLHSDELQHLASDVYRQAGVICEDVASFRASEHGRANAHVGLWEIFARPNELQPPTWWPASAQTSSRRPLAGLKVVDLTRVIAAPAVTRGLAELGASVMRVTSPNITDYSALHMDMNWGKWNSCLDLKKEEDRDRLKQLIFGADVVVQGYRPGVLDKFGFSQEGIVELCSDRPRGIISVRENCYGWHGPWRDRSGWQQISDACVGISEAFGRAMGLANGEPVTPVFPNSDYMTGIAGVCATLCALMRRATDGGSYKVDLALNYYNQWLASSVGEYPEPVWQAVWRLNDKPVFR